MGRGSKVVVDYRTEAADINPIPAVLYVRGSRTELQAGLGWYVWVHEGSLTHLNSLERFRDGLCTPAYSGVLASWRKGETTFQKEKKCRDGY